MSAVAKSWIAGGAVALLIAGVAAIFWPGVPMYDTVAQYGQVLGDAPVDDWHPPVMVRLWQLLHPLGGGTAPMFALQVALYGIGFALIVAAFARGKRWWSAGVTALVAVSPLLLGWQMVVLKDTQMLGALLAATGVASHYRLAGRRIPLVVTAAVGLLIAYATLVRANALFATVPLAVLLLPTRRSLPSVAIALAGGAAILVAQPLINHKLLRAEPSDVAKSQPLYDLAGIAVRTPMTAPSPFTQDERAGIVARHCLKPFFWDSLADPTGCEDATDRLLGEPAGQLYLQLAKAAVAHPLAYAQQRLAHWNSTERWLVPPGLPEIGPPDEAEPNDLGLAGPSTDGASSWQEAAAAEGGTPLGWPILWTAVALILAPVAWRRREEPASGLALALIASTLTLEASFLVISIASDLRYHLWPMTASALALILLSGTRFKRWQWLSGGALLAVVIAGGLIARNTLPPAPDSYEGMVQAASG